MKAPIDSDVRFDRWRVLVNDVVVVVVLLPISISGIHFFVPQAIQNQLALNYGQPNLVNLWTAAFVHNSTTHLYGNLVGWIGGTGVAYILSLELGKRQWFRRTVTAYLTVLPVLVNLASIGLFWWLDLSGVTGRGFSGVVAGTIGFTITALVIWTRANYRGIEGYVLMLVVALLGLEVFWIYGDAPSPYGVALFGLAITVGVSGIIYEVQGGAALKSDNVQKDAARFIFVVLILMFVGFYVLILFPSNVGSDGVVTNIFAHFGGIIFGAGLSYGLSS